MLSGKQTQHEVSKEQQEMSQQFNGSTTTLFQMAGSCQRERTGKKHKKEKKKSWNLSKKKKKKQQNLHNDS